MVKSIVSLLAIVATLSFPATATVTYCEDLTAGSLEEIQKFTGAIEDVAGYPAGLTSAQELDAILMQVLETAPPDESGRYRLLVAASQLNLVKSARFLVESVENLDWRSIDNEFSVTALFVSAWCGNGEVVELLLQHGASTDSESCLPFGGDPARVCVYPVFGAITGGRFEGGDPEIVCAIVGRDRADARDWSKVRSSTGQSAREFLSKAWGQHALLLSSALLGQCESFKAH
jgi:hypothetical protein